MGVIMSLLIGLLVGIVAKFLMPGRDGGGVVITSFLGIAGALIAHALGASFGYYGPNDPVGFISSVLGAMVLLGIYRLVVGNKHLPH